MADYSDILKKLSELNASVGLASAAKGSPSFLQETIGDDPAPPGDDSIRNSTVQPDDLATLATAGSIIAAKKLVPKVLPHLGRLLGDETGQLTIGKKEFQFPKQEAERISEQGYDLSRPLYHGTPAGDIKRFNPSETGMHGKGVYLTEDAEEASKYALRSNTGDTGTPTVMPVYAKGRYYDRDSTEDTIDLLNALGISAPDVKHKPEWYNDKGLLEHYNKAIGRLQQNHGTIDEAVRAAGDLFTGIRDGKHTIVFDPTAIRSRFANFDPSKSHSSNISAGLGGVSTLAGLKALLNKNKTDKDEL